MYYAKDKYSLIRKLPVGNTISQIINSGLHIICHFSSFNGNIENNAKSLETKLVDGIDIVQIIENKVHDRCTGKKKMLIIVFYKSLKFDKLFYK